ncbi:MAG: hypothetical protein IPJ77_15660 [Planctomycetes bacterium]|nr:hypothetical protein [Planctomycetota bacterium]
MPVAFPVLAARGARVMLATSTFTAESPLGAYRIELVRTLGDCLAPARFCDALPNSTGQRARIGSSGTTSLAANDLVLTCTGLPATTTGIFFAGNEPALPFGTLGNGLACVGGTLRRVGAVHAVAGAVWAPQDLGALVWGGLQQGDVRYVQLWYRNVAGGGAGSNASDALELTVCS